MQVVRKRVYLFWSAVILRIKLLVAAAYTTDLNDSSKNIPLHPPGMGSLASLSSGSVWLIRVGNILCAPRCQTCLEGHARQAVPALKKKSDTISPFLILLMCGHWYVGSLSIHSSALRVQVGTVQGGDQKLLKGVLRLARNIDASMLISRWVTDLNGVL